MPLCPRGSPRCRGRGCRVPVPLGIFKFLRFCHGYAWLHLPLLHAQVHIFVTFIWTTIYLLYETVRLLCICHFRWCGTPRSQPAWQRFSRPPLLLFVHSLTCGPHKSGSSSTSGQQGGEHAPLIAIRTRLGCPGRCAPCQGWRSPSISPTATAHRHGRAAGRRHQKSQLLPGAGGLRALHNAFAAYAVLDSGVVRPACAVASRTPPHPSSTSKPALELRRQAGDGGRQRWSFAAPHHPRLQPAVPPSSTARCIGLSHHPMRSPPCYLPCASRAGSTCKHRVRCSCGALPKPAGAAPPSPRRHARVYHLRSGPLPMPKLHRTPQPPHPPFLLMSNSIARTDAPHGPHARTPLPARASLRRP